jgi:hypothetical protein
VAKGQKQKVDGLVFSKICARMPYGRCLGASLVRMQADGAGMKSA